MKGDPSLAVGYLRLSTDAERQANSFDVQRHAIEGWARQRGARVVAWHSDERSGSQPLDKRAGLGAALLSLREHRAGLLVVHRLDRFSRDSAEAATIEREIQRRGAELVAVEGPQGDDPGSQFSRKVLIAAAELEAQLIRARIRGAKVNLRRKGLFEGGRPPYGFRLVPVEGAPVVAGKPPPQRLEPDQAEQEAIELFASLRARGHSYRRIAAEAARRGIVNREGRTLDHKTIALALARRAP